MSANSKIEWTDHTFKSWISYATLSPARDHYYAEASRPNTDGGDTTKLYAKLPRTLFRSRFPCRVGCILGFKTGNELVPVNAFVPMHERVNNGESSVNARRHDHCRQPIGQRLNDRFRIHGQPLQLKAAV